MTSIAVDLVGRSATFGADPATLGTTGTSSVSLVGAALLLVASNQVRMPVPSVLERVQSYVDEATVRRLLADGERAAEGTLVERLRALGARGAALPVLDPRTADEILGYDDDGLPR